MRYRIYFVLTFLFMAFGWLEDKSCCDRKKIRCLKIYIKKRTTSEDVVRFLFRGHAAMFSCLKRPKGIKTSPYRTFMFTRPLF